MDRFINTKREDYDLIKPYYYDNCYFTDEIKRFKKLCYIYYYNKINEVDFIPNGTKFNYKEKKIIKRPLKYNGMYIYSFALNPNEYIPKGLGTRLDQSTLSVYLSEN